MFFTISSHRSRLTSFIFAGMAIGVFFAPQNGLRREVQENDENPAGKGQELKAILTSSQFEKYVVRRDELFWQGVWAFFF